MTLKTHSQSPQNYDAMAPNGQFIPWPNTKIPFRNPLCPLGSKDMAARNQELFKDLLLQKEVGRERKGARIRKRGRNKEQEITAKYRKMTKQKLLDACHD